MLELTPWPDAVAPDRERFGPLIHAACTWCVERGHPADPDLFALICGGSLLLHGADVDGDAAPQIWTRIRVRELLRCGIPNWCSVNHASTWPLEVVPAMWWWLDFLHRTARLDPRSDPLWELRKPLICYGGLDFDGSWRPENDPSPIPCECYLPYRKTVDYLNGRLEVGTLIGDVLFDDGPGDGSAGTDPARVRERWTREPRGGGPPRRGRPPGSGRRRTGRPRRSEPG